MELAVDIKKYLNEPDMMFRRFRYKDEGGNWQRKWKQKFTDAEGKVHFIDADPKAYHPGARCLSFIGTQRPAVGTDGDKHGVPEGRAGAVEVV